MWLGLGVGQEQILYFLIIISHMFSLFGFPAPAWLMLSQEAGRLPSIPKLTPGTKGVRGVGGSSQ